MIDAILIFLGIVTCMVLCFVLAAFHEYMAQKRSYNNGVCPECGTRLEYLSRDRHGAKCYRCPKCHYKAWVHLFEPKDNPGGT